MKLNISPKISEIISFSREEAVRLGNEILSTDHLFLGIIRDADSNVISILENLMINVTNYEKN